MDMLCEHLMQELRFDGLGEVVVHARLDRALSTAMLPPSGVNFAAFDNRLKDIWLKRRRSVRMQGVSGRLGMNGHHKIDVLFLHQRADDGVDALDELLDVVHVLLERQLAVFDLRHIEDIVDEAEQEIAGRFDAVKVGMHLLRVLFFLGKARQADDGVHRRADIVRHPREELRFCLCGGLRLFRNDLELCVLAVDLAVELAAALLLDREITPDIHARIARVDDEPAGIGELDPDERGCGGKKRMSSTAFERGAMPFQCPSACKRPTAE